MQHNRPLRRMRRQARIDRRERLVRGNAVAETPSRGTKPLKGEGHVRGNTCSSDKGLDKGTMGEEEGGYVMRGFDTYG